MTTTPGLWRPGFIDNTTLAGQQDSGAVAATIGDQFFAVWVDHTNFNMGLDTIIARSFDSLGNPLTAEVNLSPGLNPAAVRLPIAGEGDGLAVAFEFALSSVDHDILLVRTDSALTLLEPNVVIDASGFFEENPSITSFSNGSLWVSYTEHFSASDSDILAKRVSFDGTITSAITLFDAGANVFADNSDLATLANGNFVAVFEAGTSGDNDIFFTIKTNAGDNVVSPTFVAGGFDSPGNEVTPHVAALADGGFVVTWVDSLGDFNGTGQGIRASVYDANGVLVQGDILVNVFNQVGLQLQADVTALPDGGFVVAWEDVGPALVDRAQRFDEAGNLVGTPVVFRAPRKIPLAKSARI
jgi:hypothetical protein